LPTERRSNLRRVLFFHHSADLYGADRVLLTLVKDINRDKYCPIVLLPERGPLVNAIRDLGVECHIVPLAIFGRNSLGVFGLFHLFYSSVKSILYINRKINPSRIDLVHSNTVAVLSGAIWAKLHEKPHVWHVHEIIERPRKIGQAISWFVRRFSRRIICNSYATRSSLLLGCAGRKEEVHVVWNGIQREGKKLPQEQTLGLRKQYGIPTQAVIIALVGRINRWKGHSLLLAAGRRLEERLPGKAWFVFAGSPPPGQEHFLEAVEREVEESPISGRVIILPFVEDIWAVWDACDIACVPSTEPEPFGMVALEAMAAEKPVVAANHGGLAEIVINGQTGALFQPGDFLDLAGTLERVIVDEKLRREMGVAGGVRAQNEFSTEGYVNGIMGVYSLIAP
jgi:glycosyltransferase involved in cell wall biosynthesis